MLKKKAGPIILTVAFLGIYLFLENFFLLMFPRAQTLKDLAANLLHVTIRNDYDWTWKTTLMLFVSFHLFSLADFIVHKWILHRKQLWIFHEYHHLPKIIMNGMPGLTARPFVFFSIAISAAISLPVLSVFLSLFKTDDVMGFIVQGVPVLLFIMTLLLCVTHSIFLRQFTCVHKFMRLFGLATPQEHILHHSRTRRCNFGNYVSFWDRLTGSYVDPDTLDFNAEPIGLNYDQDYLGALTLGRLKLSKSTRKKFGAEHTSWVDQ